MQELKQYDIAIVGGGLAGLCLSIQCAEAGHSVVLFEKEEYPFHKVCGEYISMESKDFLQRLGVKIDMMNLPVINTLEVSDVNGKSYSYPLPLGGFGISRYTLDALLCEIATAKGVDVSSGNKVTQLTFADERFTIAAEQTIKAKVVAGCFGKRSNLDVKWKRNFTLQKAGVLNNFIGIKYHIRHKHAADRIALHNFSNGYCGMGKIEDDKSCLCYLTTAQTLRSHNNSIQLMEKNVLHKNPLLKKIFSAAEFLYAEPLAISQVSFQKKTQVEDHVLMIGDAAGMITPLCGNGMSMAMHGSKLAFHAINKFLCGHTSRGEMEDGYTINWRKEFSLRLQAGRIIQRFFGGNFSTSLFLKNMHSFPAIANKIIGLTHGKPF